MNNAKLTHISSKNFRILNTKRKAVKTKQTLHPSVSEATIRRDIIRLLQYHGYLAWTQNSGGRTDKYINQNGGTSTRYTHFGGLTGASDIFAIQKTTGKFVAIEVKTPKTKNVRDRRYYQQESFIRLVNDYNGIAFFAWSLEMVAEKLNIPLL